MFGASMGQEAEQSIRQEALGDYQINKETAERGTPGRYGSALPACTPRRGNYRGSAGRGPQSQSV